MMGIHYALFFLGGPRLPCYHLHPRRLPTACISPSSTASKIRIGLQAIVILNAKFTSFSLHLLEVGYKILHSTFNRQLLCILIIQKVCRWAEYMHMCCGEKKFYLDLGNFLFQ